MRTALTLALVAAALVGCDATEPPTGGNNSNRMAVAIDEVRAVDALASGCGDVSAVLRDATDENAVFFIIDDSIAWDAANSGQTVTRTYTLPDDRVYVRVQHGTRLSIDHCDDVIEVGSEAIVDGQALAIGGTVTVTVEPSGEPVTAWSYTGMADITATDLVLDSPNGTPLSIDVIELPDLFIGWFPG